MLRATNARHLTIVEGAWGFADSDDFANFTRLIFRMPFCGFAVSSRSTDFPLRILSF